MIARELIEIRRREKRIKSLNSNSQRAPSVLPAVFAVLAMVAAVGLAQQKPTLALADEKSGIRLTIESFQSGYHTGDSIFITTKFKNISDDPILVIVDRPEEMFYRFVVVRMESANSAVPVGHTQMGKERLDLMRSFGRRPSTLRQDEELNSSFDAGRWYVMPPGIYKIACYIDMATDTTSLTRLRYVSNELAVTVTP